MQQLLPELLQEEPATKHPRLEGGRQCHTARGSGIRKLCVRSQLCSCLAMGETAQAER